MKLNQFAVYRVDQQTAGKALWHGGYGLLCLFCCLLIGIKENVKFPFIGKSLRTKNLANVCQADF